MIPTNKPKPKIPPHLDVSVVRRWEGFVKSIVDCYPQRVTISTKMSPKTVVGRLRDTMRSLVLYEWDSPVDVEKLKRIRGNIKLTVEDGQVVASSRQPTEKEVAAEVVKDRGTTGMIESYDVVRSICVLIHNNIIEGPFQVAVNEGRKKHLEELFNVVLEPTKGGYILR